MEKAAVTGATAGFRWEVPLAACIAVTFCALAAPARAAGEAGRLPPEAVIADARGAVLDQVLQASRASGKAPLKLELQASTLPRMEQQDTGFQAPRLDLSLLSGRSAALGPVVGFSGFGSRQGAQPLAGDSLGFQAGRPSFDIGLRFRHKLDGHRQIDITAWRRLTQDDDAYAMIQAREPVYGARIELNLSNAGRKSPLSFDRGFLGLQLQSGAKISIRRRNGGPMIYYRNTF